MNPEKVLYSVCMNYWLPISLLHNTEVRVNPQRDLNGQALFSSLIVSGGAW